MTAQLFAILLLIAHSHPIAKGKRSVCAVKSFELMDGPLPHPFPAYRGSAANKVAVRSNVNRMQFLSQAQSN